MLRAACGGSFQPTLAAAHEAARAPSPANRPKAPKRRCHAQRIAAASTYRQRAPRLFFQRAIACPALTSLELSSYCAPVRAQIGGTATARSGGSSAGARAKSKAAKRRSISSRPKSAAASAERTPTSSAPGHTSVICLDDVVHRVFSACRQDKALLKLLHGRCLSLLAFGCIPWSLTVEAWVR